MRRSPTSSEDLVRALPQPRPETLTAPADGQKLEEIIGDLQSEYGVPQYPQEYRITIKVAEDREARAERQEEAQRARVTHSQEDAPPARVTEAAETEVDPTEGPRREKAPAAPRVSGGTEPVEQGPSRRRRRGRRRRGKGLSSGGGQTPSA